MFRIFYRLSRITLAIGRLVLALFAHVDRLVHKIMSPLGPKR